MKRGSLFSMVVALCLILLALPMPMAAQTADSTPAAWIVEQPELGGWQTGPFPPAGFQYARHDGAFVPGPAGEPWANKIYFLGGRTSPPTESPNIWMFDPVTGTYTDTGADVVEDVSNYNANLILDDGTGRGPAVYVIGGTNKDGGGVSIGMVQRYYPQVNVAESLPAADNWNGMVGGSRVAAMGTAVVDDIIYVYGGWETNVAPYFSSETWAFDPNQPSGSRWTNLNAPLHTARSYIMSAVQDGKVYAIGGVGSYVGGELDPVATFEVLDTANLAAGWTLLAPMPTAGGEGRGYGFDSDTLNVNAPWHGKLYVVASNDWPYVSSEMLEYDIATNTWRDDLPELPTPRADLAGTFVPLCTPDPNDGLPGLWTFGGRINESCDPPLGPTEYYPLPCADCTGLTEVAVSGPVELLAGETGVYSAILEPVSATLPIDVVWSNGTISTSAAYSWAEPGQYTVVVTATNCLDTAIVTASLTVEVLCVELTGVTITGPVELLAGETGIYSVTLEPPTATPPFDLMWSNGTAGASAAYSWAEPGQYTVVVTATNCLDTAIVTASLSVEVLCVELTGATITGPAELLVGESGSYSVTLEPPAATPSIDLVWSNGTTGTLAVYSWGVPGAYTVVVTATNCAGLAEVTGTLGVTVTPKKYYVYLPIVVRKQ